jgi:hypothetical protein
MEPEGVEPSTSRALSSGLYGAANPNYQEPAAGALAELVLRRNGIGA